VGSNRCDAPKEYGPAKTLYNRWKRWSDNGVFARIMTGLAAVRRQRQWDSLA
jgi:transposase